MGKATCEDRKPDFRVDFDRRLKLEFHGSRVTSDVGLLAFRELDEALGLTEMADDGLVDTRSLEAAHSRRPAAGGGQVRPRRSCADRATPGHVRRPLAMAGLRLSGSGS
jgi:hypothetical protein